MSIDYSLVGRKGYRAPPGNQFLIDVSRSEKYHRKRFAMLKVDKMSHIPFLCKLVTPLLENVYLAISQLIVHLAQQLRCLTPCFEGLRSL